MAGFALEVGMIEPCEGQSKHGLTVDELIYRLTSRGYSETQSRWGVRLALIKGVIRVEGERGVVAGHAS